jgi:RHS repeat-associated protein
VLEWGFVLLKNYDANELYKTVMLDKSMTTSCKDTEEFKDQEGIIVLKRTYNGSDPHDTYYIYDQYGNLSYVLPPLAEGVATQTVLNNLGYQYQYDYRNRLVAKKLPGKQWEFIVYDKLDRPVATGPAFSPYGTGVQGWMITQYDVFGRVTQTGWKNLAVTTTTRKNYQANINSGTNPFTLTAPEMLTKNYYDNYSFAGAPTTIPTTLADSQLGLATNVKGLQTGTWVKVLDNASSTTAEISYTLYDKKYRPVRSYTKNHLGGYTQVDTNMDWAGKTIYTVTKHKRTNTATELVVKDMFTYSPQDKLLVHKQKINALTEQLISSNTYDDLGQLTSKNVGGTDATGAAGLQKVDYAYNIRGWLKEINKVDNLQDDLFAFKINYNDAVTATALFNGNISETYWKTASDNLKRQYTYQYDGLNRLLEGNYRREGGNYKNSYLETMSYDKNGNIQKMYRNGDNDDVNYEFNIDNLFYTYDQNNKNLLKKVFDASNSPQGFKDDSNGNDDPEDDYQYDLNGNMTADANKKIELIIYNHLNLPVEITFEKGEITYLYNAVGQKLQKVVRNEENVVTEYLSGFQYFNEKLKHFPHAEGYVNVIAGKYKYVFNYTDHLGNVRLGYSDGDDNNTITQNEIIEENHYYPFGLKHSAYNTQHLAYMPIDQLDNLILNQMPRFAGDGENNYKYNGKEYQDELGLNMYDYGARNYDPAIGRWMNIDPLAEKFASLSTYNYTVNNPVNFIDPDGKDVYKINQQTGEITILPTEGNAHSYYLIDGDKQAFLGAFEYNEDGLIALEGNNSFTDNEGNSFGFNVKDGNEYRSYIRGDAFASLLGTLADTGTNDLTMVGFSLKDGSSPDPSVSHKEGKNGDLRYLTKDKSGDKVLLGDENFDMERQNDFNKSLQKFGWKSMLSEKFKPFGESEKTLLEGTTHYSKSRHNNHLHLQAYNPKTRVIHYGGQLDEVVIKTVYKK